MWNWKYKTRAGIEVELTETDKRRIHRHFEFTSTLKCLTEAHPNDNENTLKQMAYEASYKASKYDFMEEDIDRILNEYEPATLFIEAYKDFDLYEDMVIIDEKIVVLEGKTFDRVHVLYIDNNRAGLTKWCAANSLPYSLGEFTEKMPTLTEKA